MSRGRTFYPPHTEAEIERAKEIIKNAPNFRPFDPPNYELIWAKAVIRDDFKYRKNVFLLKNPEFNEDSRI